MCVSLTRARDPSSGRFIRAEELARRAAISEYARTRFRGPSGRFELRTVEVEGGYSRTGRESPDHRGAEDAPDEAGWDYVLTVRTKVRVASADERTIRRALERRDPHRRYWTPRRVRVEFRGDEL